jgi:hypothetical protein
MNKREQLMYDYVGMTESRFAALADIHAGRLDEIHSATMTHFIDGHLVDRETKKLTSHGSKILSIAVNINLGTFIPWAPAFPEEDFKYLANTTRLARLPEIGQFDLRSIHLKILRRAARVPGAVFDSYVPAFGHDAMAFLYATRLIRIDPWRQTSTRYSFVTLSLGGRHWLEFCINAARNWGQA